MKHERFRRLAGEQMVWTQHENTAEHGVCPIDGDEYVRVTWSDGRTAESNADGLNWARAYIAGNAYPSTPMRVTHYSTCEPRFPELAKEVLAKQDGSQKIAEFLEWLDESALDVVDSNDTPYAGGAAKLIADFFGIDIKKAEAERRQLLDEFVASQAVQS